MHFPLTPLVMRLPMPAPAPARPRRRGFTVIEMAIVVVIIGLLAAMVIPRIGRGLAQRELERASQTLAVDLQNGPQLAARLRRPVLFRAVGTTGYELVDRAAPATRYVYRNFTTASRTGVSFGIANTLVFFPNGITSGARSYTVTVNGQTRTVTVTRIGHVRRIGA